MAMFLIVRVRNDSRKYFLPKTFFYVHMTSGAETVHLTLTGTEGRGECIPPSVFFSEMAAEAPGGSCCNFA